MQPNEIIKAIGQQIGAGELKLAGFQVASNMEDFVSIRKGLKRFEVKYCEGSDSYTIVKQKFKRFYGNPTDISEECLEDIYFDQLRPMIEEFFNFIYLPTAFMNAIRNPKVLECD